MNNCSEYMELISAYSDGELAEADRQRLEEHLAACENCSALLDLYREMAGAVAESAAPVPESLCGDVMKEISGEGTADSADSSKRRRVMRIVLTRYVPIAACLALVLLALPRLLNLGRSSNDEMSTGGSMSVADTAAQRNESGENMAGEMAPGGSAPGAAAGGGSSGSGSRDSGATAPSAAQSSPAAAPDAAPIPESADDANDANFGSAPTPEPMDMDNGADATDDSLQEQEIITGVEDAPQDLPGEADALLEGTDEPSASDGRAPTQAGAPMIDVPSDLPFAIPDMEGVGDFVAVFNEFRRDISVLLSSTIYASIKITVGFSSADLATYGYDTGGDEVLYFALPREAAEMIIGMVQGYGEAEVTFVNEDGEFAVLIVTLGG